MYLLRLRHWQTFLLLFVLPFALQHGLLALFSWLAYRPGPVTDMLLDALPATVYVLWTWRMALWLYRRRPASINISPLYLHLGTLYFVLYTLLFVYTLAIVRDSLVTGMLPLGMLALLLPMHLFATFCYLYLVYFASRSLATVEQQRVVELGEYLSLYFMFMLLPIGVWFLQPRLRRLYQRQV